MPQLVVGVAIVYLGVFLIRGKKVELDEQARSSESSSVYVNATEDKKEGDQDGKDGGN